MDRRWLPLNALRAFEAVGKNLSFTAAAADLLVSQSAVSRHVISLEQLLGTQLFERRPQGLALTPAGDALLPVVAKSLDRLSQALDQVVESGGRPQRSLRVRLPATFAYQLAVPILRDFRREYPDLGLDIESNPQLPQGERDPGIAVIYSEPQVSDHVHDLLWMVRLTLVCHPAVAPPGGQDMARFLAGRDLLHVRLDNRPRHYLWEMFARQQGLDGLDYGRGLVFDTAQLAVQYALSGDGVALVDPYLFQEEIASGRLVQPFDAYIDDGYGYYLSIHPDDLGDTSIGLFRSWLIRRFAGSPWKAKPNDKNQPSREETHEPADPPSG